MPGSSLVGRAERSSLSTTLALVVAAGVLASSVGAWIATRETSHASARDAAMAVAKRRAARLARSLARLQRGERLAFYEGVRSRRDLVGIADLRGTLWPGSPLSSVAASQINGVIVEGHGLLEIRGAEYAAAAKAVVPAAPDLVVVTAAPIESSDVASVLAAIALLAIVGSSLGAAALARRVFVVTPVVRALSALGDDAPWPSMSAPTTREVASLVDAVERLRERVARAETQRASAELARKHADRAKTAFLATVSHELRTPLQAVLGFADVLLAGIDGPLADEHVESVRVIRKSGEYLLTLVNDALDLSALASGSIALGSGAVDVAEVAAEVVEIARGASLDVGTRLSIHAERGVPKARADATRLRQVLHNLVGNALKHARGSDVFIDVRCGPRSTVEVQVRDGGPGISASDLERIFEPYQRVGDSDRTSGVGLGLTISRALVEEQGGSIAVASEPGLGTAFTVRWPSIGASSGEDGPA